MGAATAPIGRVVMFWLVIILAAWIAFSLFCALLRMSVATNEKASRPIGLLHPKSGRQRNREYHGLRRPTI
jgi:hypothetical protein